MGKGVVLNENTYRKMARNGIVEWQCEVDGIKHCYTAEHDRFTLQLRENNRATHYVALSINKEPWHTLEQYYDINPNLPPKPSADDFRRAWKRQVKRKFNQSGWLRN